MAIVLTRLPKRKQKAVWWNRTGTDSFGNPILDAPLEIDCRWEDIVIEFTTPEGAEARSQSVVYPDREMKPGDYLWQGLLAEAPADPVGSTDALEIKRFDDLPDFNAKRHLLTAYL